MYRDTGETWTSLVCQGIELYDIDFVDASYGWAVGDGGRILHSRDGGHSCNYQESGTTTLLRTVSFVSRTQGWTGGDGGVLLCTEDGGNTWLPANPSPAITGAVRSIAASAYQRYAVAVVSAGRSSIHDCEWD